LVAFEGKNIIRLLGEQLPGNGPLAAQRIDRNNRVS